MDREGFGVSHKPDPLDPDDGQIEPVTEVIPQSPVHPRRETPCCASGRSDLQCLSEGSVVVMDLRTGPLSKTAASAGSDPDHAPVPLCDIHPEIPCTRSFALDMYRLERLHAVQLHSALLCGIVLCRPLGEKILENLSPILEDIGIQHASLRT